MSIEIDEKSIIKHYSGNITDNTPVNQKTQFDVGSLAKQFVVAV